MDTFGEFLWTFFVHKNSSPWMNFQRHVLGSSLVTPDVTTLTVHMVILDLKFIFRKDSNRQVCRVFLKANTERQGCPANVGGRKPKPP